MSAIERSDVVEDARREDDRGGGHDVRIRSVRKRYGALEALRGIDLDIRPASFTVLLGPSGSGKTTLLRGIAGIERFDSGRVEFGDRLIADGAHHLAAERRGLAMVFQDYALWPHMTVLQNVGYALRRRHLASSVARSRALETLDRVGLSAKADSYPQELSGGQQQRVALARAIVGDPALVLFDEPLSNLDADLREHLRVEISTLIRASGATALYITHDQAEAFALADEIGVLRTGRIEQLGTPEEIYRHPATPFVARFTGLAGSFSGQSAGEREGHVRVRVGDHELACMPGDLRTAGDFVNVLIRPTATRLVDPGARTTGGSTAALNRSADLIPATILDVAYRGRGYDHVVHCAYGDLTSVFDLHPWPRGTECFLVIDPDGCMAFRAQADVSDEI
jgi:iron(III) transport system ATP-binding protein